MDDTTSRGSRLTERVQGIERSSIRVMFDMAEARRGEDLVRLEVGEPDFDTPSHVVEAANRAAMRGDTHYTSNAGLPELRRAIAEKMARENDVHVDPDTQVTVTTGGMEALHLAILTVANPGEEVLLPTPTWPNYVQQARLADATPVEVPLSAADGFDLDPGRVVDAMTDDTAVVILTSPSNPTGRVYDRDAMHAVVDAAAEHDAYVISDEVYRSLTYEGDERGLAADTDHPDRVLTVNSFSKQYAMTGWRVGWLAGPADVVDGVTKIRESTTACTSSVAQHAAIAALTGPQDPIREMRDAFRKRRDYVAARIEEMPVVSAPPSEGAFYAFLDVREFEGSSLDVATRLLEEYGVVTAPGDGFGEAGAGYLRLSFANSLERLELGLDRIEAMVRAER